MSKLLERQNISDSLYVYLQSNSKYWYCRFVLYGKWYAKATKKTNKDEAIAMAHRILLDYQIRAETNTLVDSKRFKVVAEKAIEKMETELLYGGGKVSYRDYIGTLRKYHIPFFDRTYITSIDQEMIRDFDKDRIEKFKRIPARSTLQTHNAALMMVFKEAIDRKWMIPMQIPVLNSEGTSGQRRAAFSKEEYNKVMDAVIALEQNARAKKSQQIRELLLSYMDFSVHTGIRPGTEMEGITWGDLKMHSDEHNIVFYVTITKGKTTKYTGPRKVVCKRDVIGALTRLRERFPLRTPNQKLFLLANGEPTKQLGKAFEKALQSSGLKESPRGPRTLYSLRHTYITWQLLNGTSIDVITRQCGTSTEMIEQHYSHVKPEMFADALSGVTFDKEEPKALSKKTLHRRAKTAERDEKRFKEWAEEYKRRGCI